MPAQQRIRQRCLTHLQNYEESMRYGMASYSRKDVVEIAFASQKNNVAFYVLRTEVLDAHRNKFAPSAIGKGCIRYTNLQTIDFSTIETMLIETKKANGTVC